MSGFLGFLTDQWRGFFVLALLVLTGVLVIQWLAWIFSMGRFKGPRPPRRETPIRHVFADLLVKIIDDFRHLLALVIVVIFALALMYVMVLVAYEPEGRLEGAGDGLQAVVSSMGGLIGAIIGYYFGEKAGARFADSDEAAPAGERGGVAVQLPPAVGSASPVELAPSPPPTGEEP